MAHLHPHKEMYEPSIWPVWSNGRKGPFGNVGGSMLDGIDAGEHSNELMGSNDFDFCVHHVLKLDWR